jgi:hypothetical protein
MIIAAETRMFVVRIAEELKQRTGKVIIADAILPRRYVQTEVPFASLR